MVLCSYDDFKINNWLDTEQSDCISSITVLKQQTVWLALTLLKMYFLVNLIDSFVCVRLFVRVNISECVFLLSYLIQSEFSSALIEDDRKGARRPLSWRAAGKNLTCFMLWWEMMNWSDTAVMGEASGNHSQAPQWTVSKEAILILWSLESC